MLEFFLLPENAPFSVALGLMFSITLLEVITTFIGAGFSQILEGLMPDIDTPDVDIDVDMDADMDADIEISTTSVFVRFLGWIKVRGVPMIMVLLAFLTLFALTGFFIQGTVKSILSFYLPWYLAVIPALVITLPLVRQISLLLAKFVVKDETQVVSTNTFIGKIAVISLGTAKSKVPAEARLTDKFGTTHYVRVVPDLDNEELEQGSEVLLVKKEDHIFKAIKNPNIKLSD